MDRHHGWPRGDQQPYINPSVIEHGSFLKDGQRTYMFVHLLAFKDAKASGSRKDLHLRGDSKYNNDCSKILTFPIWIGAADSDMWPAKSKLYRQLASSFWLAALDESTRSIVPQR